MIPVQYMSPKFVLAVMRVLDPNEVCIKRRENSLWKDCKIDEEFKHLINDCDDENDLGDQWN